MSQKIKSILLSLVLAFAMLVPSAAYASEAWMQEEARLYHVTDAVGIMSEGEIAQLEQQAQAIEDQYGFGVYMVIVEDYTAFTSGGVFDAAMAIYQEYSLGVGPGKDGLMLLLSMWDRDYSLITYGDRGNYAFNDEGRTYLTNYFLDDFANDDWYTGFADLLEWSELYIQAADAGEPYSGLNVPMSRDEALEMAGIYLLAVLLIPLLISFIAIKAMDAKMRSVAAATQATAYISSPLNLTSQRDSFSHTTRVTTLIPKDTDSGGPSISHSGGFSGTSGKF